MELLRCKQPYLWKFFLFKTLTYEDPWGSELCCPPDLCYTTDLLHRKPVTHPSILWLFVSSSDAAEQIHELAGWRWVQGRRLYCNGYSWKPWRGGWIRYVFSVEPVSPTPLTSNPALSTCRYCCSTLPPVCNASSGTGRRAGVPPKARGGRLGHLVGWEIHRFVCIVPAGGAVSESL